MLRSAAPLPEPFTVPLPLPLPVPPVLRPARSDSMGDHYEIAQRVGELEILPGLRTRVWGYEGIFPGPTTESRSGRQTIVRHRNELAVPTVVHLHGGRTLPEHGGYPADLVLPAGLSRPGRVPSGPRRRGVRPGQTVPRGRCWR